jgi:hypothetical protein
LTALACLVCVGTVYAVMLQRQELRALQAQPSSEQTAQSSLNQSEDPKKTGSGTEASSELLRLRSEVTRLSARKRELAHVVQEAEQLRAQLASAQTNSPAGSRLPPGYIRKSQAQMVGYSTPENTVQSFLWALQQHDASSVLRAFTPAQAQALRARFEPPAQPEQGFFKETDQLPGLAIEGRRNLPDGSVQLQVTFAPGLPSQTFRLQVVNGEWKLADAGL